MVIGITGESGCGKSGITKKLASILNGKIILIDEIGHRVVEQPEVQCELREAFGDKILDESKKFSRKKLGDLVFSSKKNMQVLISITWEKMSEIINAELAKNKLVILDYLLLPITYFWKICDLKVLIKCPKEIRFERLIKRDKVTVNYLKKRQGSSIDFNKYSYDKIYSNIKTEDVDFIVQDLFETIKKKS